VARAIGLGNSFFAAAVMTHSVPSDPI